MRREHEQQEEQRRREEKQKREEQQRRDEQQRREEQERREKQRQEEEEERQWKEEREQRKREAEAFEREKREKEEQLAREREEEEKRRLAAAAQQENQEERRKKDLLLARLREMDSNKEGSGSRRGSTSEYSFSRPVENMHHGLPAYESPVGRARARPIGNDASDDDITGYQPSFIPPKSKRSAGDSGHGRRAKKSDLMTELFGASSTVKTSPVQQPKPQEEDRLFLTALNNSGETRHHDTSTTLFGGGSAFLEDGDAPSPRNQALLPRRGRQPTTTIHTRPTINAIDDFDDDIEEVIL